MYNSTLDTFLALADCRSFNKAAEKLYVTPAAVMKQMNTLESRLGLQLIKRTKQGVILTAAGESIQKDAKKMIRESQRAIERARMAQENAAKIIRVGSSLLHPCYDFLALWNERAPNPGEFEIEIVPYRDDQFFSVLSTLGSDIDFLVGTFGSPQALENADFCRLWDSRMCIAVPKTNPLVSKTSLELQDLYGQHIITVRSGGSPVLDKMRSLLKMTHPQIIMEDGDYLYDMDTFNDCEERGVLLLTQERWRNIHPSLKTLPVQWDFTLPYGLLYAKELRGEPLWFLERARELKREV